MTETTLRARAESRLEQALATSGAQDPREPCRSRLRSLRDRNPEAYRRAVQYYETRLVPAVASDTSDPIAEWLEYGRLLAELTTPGRTVQIDTTGRERPFAPPSSPDHLVLHLPVSSREPVLLVARPRELSPAQRATCDLLVRGLQS